ncbi:WcbI family polysaccharide biosynthesis putative acetyltransferase [Arsenicicoccus sp. oral taxon 190]|uniref:WcbI family polysaccharide biosynthesis putative acetyltransferase n=1 Tax=Arsenicicoccus sp. oral taxon 190 TaxID=1658671 RepID=UPI000679ED98|nr:WcbI family polysaccharide biosynthesis putative acetyltransferase [Arsenicicoccus sp. oral taxon 190]AKT52503.1 hypothetical protein ADJ73_01425 [Arsenicicoccus sp. oral taxon 190]
MTRPDNPLPVDETDGRVRHYAEFYGVTQPASGMADAGAPLAVVLGNCQAEALRVLLDASPQLRTVRVPPVFELDDADVHHLDLLLQRADVLVAQPVKDGYRGLPLGTQEVLARHPRLRLLAIPVCFYAGLYPWQVLVRTPESGDPPGVPYHDLRTLLEAAGSRPRDVMPADAIRAVARESVAELRRRESVAGTVVVSDLLEPAGADACHVVNHPGNTLLLGLARRVQEALGLPVEARDPGRTLLPELYAPLDERVVAALDLDAEPRVDWRLRGEVLPDAEVREVQLAWLREHPEIVELGLTRHARTIEAMGWR